MSEAVAGFREKKWPTLREAYEDTTTPPLSSARTERSTTPNRQQVRPPAPDVDIHRRSTFVSQYPRAWRAMRKLLGTEEAIRLAQLCRNDAMTRLRVEHRWSLQAIADLFDLSRERVRQLTPSIQGNGMTPDASDNVPSDPARIRIELASAFHRAVRTPGAWNGRGQVSKSWVIERLGYEPDLPELDFRRLGDSKAELILRHGIGLETKCQMRAWVREMYFERHMTYAEIANWLSERFVPVAPMTVHRFATDTLAMEGYRRGQRVDRG